MTATESTSNVRALSSPPAGRVTWLVALDGRRRTWDWNTTSMDPRALSPVRRPRSGAASRHIPVRAYSVTTGCFLELESGLEHDLVRVLDRDPDVTFMVAQPFQLDWSAGGRRSGRRRHTPDLLSVTSTGQVTVWDVKRPEVAGSDGFAIDREVTQAACRAVGWAYKVFTGLVPAHRHNLMWLHPYRRCPAWAGRYHDELISAAVGGCRLGDLVASADPERSAVAWHLIWAGGLRVDLAVRLSSTTQVVA